MICSFIFFFFFSSRRRHTRSLCDWSSDVCSSDLNSMARAVGGTASLSSLGTLQARRTPAAPRLEAPNMSKDTLSDCPLGLTADDLARFYNGELPENRAHSIADHLASCPVCGAHLTENARVGSDPISSDPIASAALPGLALAADPSRHEIAADKYAEHPAMIRGQKRVRAAVTGLGAIAAGCPFAPPLCPVPP